MAIDRPTGAGAGPAQRTSPKDDPSREKTNTGKTDLKTTVAHAAEEVSEEASRMKWRLKHRASQAAESQKAQVAEVTRDLGAAVRRASAELNERGEVRTSQWADALAEQCEEASDYLQRRSFGGIWQDLEDIARRRPVLVVGGLFALGLAAARFLRASRPAYAGSPLDQRHTGDRPYGAMPGTAGSPLPRAATPGGPQPSTSSTTSSRPSTGQQGVRP